MNTFEQGLLTYLSPEQIHRIQSKQIGIGGAGGLGSNVAVLLARCGFRRFVIMDFDHVEAANLNRQFYFLNDLGEHKVDALSRHLHAINPDIDCDSYNTSWHPGLANDPFKTCDILVEAFDWAETKAGFVDFYSGLVSFIVSGNGLAGIQGPPLTVKRQENIFIVGDQQTEACRAHPPMAPRVTACAALMADVVTGLTLRTEPFF